MPFDNIVETNIVESKEIREKSLEPPQEEEKEESIQKMFEFQPRDIHTS